MSVSEEKRLFRLTPVVWILSGLLLSFSLLFYLWASSGSNRPADPPYSGNFPPALESKTLNELAQLVAAVRQNPKAPALPVTQGPLLKQVPRPVYVGLRAGGRLVASEWAEGSNWEKNLTDALQNALRWVPPLYADDIDSVEICLTHSFKELPELDDDLRFHQGLLGLEIEFGRAFTRIDPLRMLSENLSFQRALNNFLVKNNQDPKATPRERLRLRTFQAYQILVRFEPQPRAIEMVRGNTPMADLVSHAEVESLTDELARWLVRQVDEEGGIPYLIFPGYNETSNRNNMMARQFLATWALGQLATREPTLERKEAFRRNFRHNLLTYFRTDGQTAGLPEPNGRLGLGGLALFGLAMQEDEALPGYNFLFPLVNAGIMEMWNPETGAFRSYKHPVEKDYNQNFYPGEALLYWSVLLEKNPDPELLAKFKKSFHYYRKFHRDERNPAFIPWHTQAYYKVWKLDRDEELKDFIFEMNDWLLDMVLWEKAEFPDFRGQFWNPEHPEYGGSPHVSSTAVYLEGLTVAFKLAVEENDQARQKSYREAILKGLRSLVLHQFRDEVDMFYVINPERVRGGLRTTVYNNILRCDNGPHALMALLRVREFFGAEHYRFGE